MECNSSPTQDVMSMMEYSKFKVIYEELGIATDVADRVWGLLTELVNQNRGELTKESQNLEEWLACVLYIVTIDMRCENMSQAETNQSTKPVVTVSDILKKTNTTVLELFKKLKVIRDVRQMTRSLEENLIALERKYCITCPLFNKYEKMFEDVFLESSEKEAKYRLCWTLFVYIKAIHYPEHAELVITFELLVCCFIYVMRRTPSFQLKPPYDSIVPEPNGCHYINELCTAYGVPVDDIPDMLNSIVEPFIATLPQELGNLEVDKLAEVYLCEYRKLGDINELLFLEHDKSVAALLSNERKARIEENTEMKPNSQSLPETPVTTALQTVHNLKMLLQNSPDGPSSKLQEYFQNCSVNPASTIVDRLNSLQDVFIRRFVAVTNQNQRQIAQQRYQLSVRLYFRVLESLLVAEEERLSVQDFSHLLNNPTFHTCLLACSVEVVLVTYEHMWMPAGPSMMAFPWILNVFEVHAYDFYKVLESFIRAEPKLTKDVVKHLQEVETRILESMAWESGSPLYEVLRKTETVRIHMPPPSPRSVQNSPVGETSSAAQLYLSPIRRIPTNDVQSPVTNIPGSMEPPQSPLPKRKSNSLTLFYNKVSRLAYARLKTLCGFLKIHNDLQLSIWTCVQHIVTQKSDLMRDRHLDQIILCCVYSICKVKENEIKFKTIVAMYKNLPHASPQVYKNALIAENRYDSIIAFYNQIFMHNLKSYILSFASTKQAPSMSPVPNTVTSPITKSPVYKLPGWNNFFVSPLKDSPFKYPLSPNQLTPRSRQLYSFGEGLRGETGSAEKLRAINESVKASKHTIGSPLTSPRSQPRSQKCLKFDTSPGEENNSLAMTAGFLPVRRVPRSKVALSFEDPEQKNEAN